MSPKPWYASKTLIFAGLTGALAALNALSGAIDDPQALSWLALAVALLNAALRWNTQDPIRK